MGIVDWRRDDNLNCFATCPFDETHTKTLLVLLVQANVGERPPAEGETKKVNADGHRTQGATSFFVPCLNSFLVCIYKKN